MQKLNKFKIASGFFKNNIFILPVVDSTNQYLIERVDALYAGDVCIADYQIHGRGKCGKYWFSPLGNNIYLSIYWCFSYTKILSIIHLSVMLGIVIAELLKRLGIINISLKWPNDIYLNGRKLAGILVEIIKKNINIIHVVIGIGINVNISSDISSKLINFNYISLQDIGFFVDRNLFISELIKVVHYFLKGITCSYFEEFVDRWMSLDYFYNQIISVKIGNKIIRGISRGINVQGALLLEQFQVIYPFFIGRILDNKN